MITVVQAERASEERDTDTPGYVANMRVQSLIELMYCQLLITCERDRTSKGSGFRVQGSGFRVWV